MRGFSSGTGLVRNQFAKLKNYENKHHRRRLYIIYAGRL
jgi:hypothetical protein